MRNSQYKIYIVLLLLCITSGDAGASVYKIVDNSTTSYGTVLEPCDNISEWEAGGYNGTIELNSTLFILGNGSIQVNSVNGDAATATKTINHNFSSDKNIVFWFNCNKSTYNQIQIQFSSEPDFSKRMYKYINPTGAEFTWTRNGWNGYVFNKSDFGIVNDESWNNNMVRMRLIAYSKPGTNTSVLFDYIGYNYTSKKPTVIMSFDDGLQSVYDIAYPIMKNNSQVGTLFVITDLVGTDGYCTLEELQELQSEGWDISSHTATHPDLTNVADIQLEYELNSSYDWLVSNGFEKSANSIAYPGGRFDARVLEATKKRYLFGRTCIMSTAEMHPQNYTFVPNAPYDLPLTLKIYEVRSYIYPEAVNSSVDDLIVQGGNLDLLFHGFTNETESTYRLSESNFTRISDYIASKSSSIDVVPLSFYIAEMTSNFTASRTSGQSPASITFYDTSVDTPYSWFWDFGDGGTSTEQNPTHIYNTDGIYSVSLTVTNDAGSDTLIRTGYIKLSGIVGNQEIGDYNATVNNTTIIGSRFTAYSSKETEWGGNGSDIYIPVAGIILVSVIIIAVGFAIKGLNEIKED